MEARQSIRWNGQGEEVSYAPLSDARHFALEVARFWRAEGHIVTLSRIGMDVSLTVWDHPSDPTRAATGPMILTIDVRAWDDDAPTCPKIPQGYGVDPGDCACGNCPEARS